MDEAVRMTGGRLFHARDAATGKARSPSVDRYTDGTTSVVQYCANLTEMYEHSVTKEVLRIRTNCRRVVDIICPRPSPLSVGAEATRAAEPVDRNVAVGSHGQYVPMFTAAAACRVNGAVSKAAC